VKKKEEWSVDIEYKSPGGIDHELDKALESLAKAAGGKDGGSGYYFPTSVRDISFYFIGHKKALKFKKTVKTKYRKASVSIVEQSED